MHKCLHVYSLTENTQTDRQNALFNFISRSLIFSMGQIHFIINKPNNLEIQNLKTPLNMLKALSAGTI
jgi:hypothetical protein